MQRDEVRLGMYVTCHDTVTGPVYTVAGVGPHSADLRFTAGGRAYNGGTVAFEYLRHPTPEQLAHAGIEVKDV